MNKMKLCAMLVGATLASGGATAKTLWVDDFENGLSKWVGKSNAAPENFARLENDPVNAGHGKVITFTSLVIEGAVYTQTSFNHAELKKPLKLEFDYLGIPGRGGVAGDLGGYIGYARNSSPGPGAENHRWVGGTNPSYGVYKGDNYIHIEDDGQWHHYKVDMSASDFPNFQLMLEDYAYANGVAGDAYFDNITLTDADGVDVPPVKPPVNPVKPIDPVKPPVEPVKPPVNPVKPIDPVKPPVEPVKPPVNPVKPIDPVKPPVEPVKPPVNPVKPVDPVKPPVPPTACQCATYTSSDHSLNLPEIKMSLSNGLTGEATGETQRFTGRMKRFELYSTAKGPVYGFNVLCDTTAEVVTPNGNPQCVSTLENGTLVIPCVEIPANGLCDDGSGSTKKCTTTEKYEVILDKITYPKSCNNCETSDGGMSFILREMKKLEATASKTTVSTTEIKSSSSSTTTSSSTVIVK
ncbi:MAG: hypothetical protein PHP00_09045 [Thiotrichaceae bacterium]|nr:hypothetical protein [Thiotrichaceae bacterium]